MRAFLPVVILVYVSIVVQADPTPPYIGKTLWYRHSLHYTSEGLSIDAESIDDSINQRNKFSSVTPHGVNTQLGRYDLGYLFYLFHVFGTPTCVTVKFPPGQVPVVPAPSFAAWPFSHKAYINGDLADVFAVRRGLRDLYTRAFDRRGRMVSSTHPRGSEIMYMWLNNTQLPGGLFDVPTYCNLSASVPAGPEDYAIANQHSLPIGSPLRVTGMLRSVAREHEHLTKSNARMIYRPTLQYPDAVDNRMYATTVREQAPCGSCWAFSTIAATEIAYNRMNHRLANKSREEWFSTQAIVDCVFNRSEYLDLFTSARGCYGGSPLLAMRSIIRDGIPWERDYPYDGVTGYNCRRASIKNVERPLADAKLVVQGSVSDIMSAVAEHGAVVSIVSISPDSFFFYAGGIYDDPQCTPQLDHAITIVGYGSEVTSANVTKNYWIMKNSWGLEWGEGGYMRIARGVNRCGIEDYVFVPIARI